VRHFVIASGVNYDKLRLNNSFLDALKLRSEFLVHQHRGQEELTLTLFDFTSGRNTQLLVDRQGRRKEKDRGLNFKRVTQSSYEQKNGQIRFKDLQPDVMSIVDVYDFVEDIGAGDDHHSLYELSVFSHAYVDGPIVVNSRDDQERTNPDGTRTHLTGNERDPDDKDARAGKDFRANNRRLTAFQNAFSPDATIRMWGCLHTPYVVELFRVLFKHKDYKERGVKDAQPIKLTLDKNLRVQLQSTTLKRGLGGEGWSATFGDLRRFFHGELVGCYNAWIAMGAKTKTYGGAPGAGADFGRDGAAPMRIVLEPSHNKQIRDFYREYLHVEFDSQTNYALFPPQYRPFPAET
jgi:hypothetical protein